MTKQFALTEENCKRYLAMHPDAKTVSGDLLKHRYKSWIDHGRPEVFVFDDGTVWPAIDKSSHPEFEFPPLKYYFKNTPENIAAYEKKFGRKLSIHLSQECIGMMPSGWVTGSESEKYYLGEGRLEYVFEDKPALKQLPEGYYFRATQENIDAVLKEYPDTVQWDGNKPRHLNGLCYYSYKNMDNSLVLHLKIEGAIDRKKLREFTPEKEVAPNGYTELKLDEPKQFPNGYYFLNTPESIAAFKREFPDEKADPHPNKYCSGKYIYDNDWFHSVGHSNLLDSSSYKEYKFSGAVSQDSAASVVAQDQSSSVKDEDMLSSQEVQQIVEALKGTKEITNKTSITRRALGFAGRSTKRSLGYVFAPAARWTQNIVFLAATTGVLYGGYKVYDYVSNISLPRIVWDSKFLDSEQSPSDR